MDNSRTSIGKTFAPSTTQDVTLIVDSSAGMNLLKNQMVYFDVTTTDGTVNRAFGFINEIRTDNDNPKSSSFLRSTSRNAVKDVQNGDYRIINLKVASTFAGSGDSWGGGAPLPTSPSSGTDVFAVDTDLIAGLFTPEKLADFTYLGTLRGAGKIDAPLTLPYFGGKRGASSSAILGKTGSGKTSFTTGLLIDQMKHKDHAIIIVDPQGQWNNENGFVYSPQKVAEALGRKVHKIRVGEDIRLDLTEDNLSNMLAIVDPFAKVGRMAKENRDLLASEVGDLIVRRGYRYLAKDHRELLSDVFRTIIKSDSTVARIYASEDRRESFKASLAELVDDKRSRVESYILNNYADFNVEKAKDITDEIYDDAVKKYDAFDAEPSEDELESVNLRWEKILSKFSPLLNLFMTSNIAGGLRRPLGGTHGILDGILQVRNSASDPAPYVILDMSPDVKNKAKSAVLGDKATEEMNMRKLLDNDTIKASILKIIFGELKEASEEAFADGGGNLNTQIVFDEAWRYAPDSSDDEVILDLSKKLEGFALDTRKFGIGWTYILQSPTDLRNGIWKQLKYVYAGYGLVGADLKKLADLTDDPNTQLQTYKQFTPPDLTGDYPFMIMGSVSPLITAQIPLFLNSYTSVEEFFAANKEWMDAATKEQGLPSITASVIDASNRKLSRKPAAVSTEKKSFAVGNTSESYTPKAVETSGMQYASPDDGIEPPF